jgi:hypothetical protein
VLWVLGDLVGLPFLAAQLIHMMREDESDAARIDAELDAHQAQLEAAHLPAAPRDPANPRDPATPRQPSASAAPDDQADQEDLSDRNEPQEPQLWWETDPRFTSRFKPSS